MNTEQPDLQVGTSNVFVEPKIWNGEKRVDIRYWYQTEDCPTLKPTTKGMYFKLPEWEEFKKMIPIIDKLVGKLDHLQEQQQQQQQPKKPYFNKRQNKNNGTIGCGTASTPK